MQRLGKRLATGLLALAMVFAATPALAQTGLRVLQQAELARIGRALGLVGTPTQAELLSLLRSPSVYSDPRLESYLIPTAGDEALVSLLRSDSRFLNTVRGSLEGARLFRQSTAATRLCGTTDGASSLRVLGDVAGIVGSPTPAYVRAQTVISGGYTGLDKGWLANWSRHPTTDAFVMDLTSLSAPEQRRILEQVVAKPPGDPELEEAIKLALYDPPTWGGYVFSLSTMGVERGVLEGSLLPVIQGMPGDLRTRVLGGVQTLYLRSEKGIPDGRSTQHKPRRALDILQRGLDDPAARFLDSMAEGRGAREAYDLLLRAEQNNLMGGAGLVYATEDVLVPAREVQQLLRGMRGDDEIVAWIVGSVPNGKAAKGSDLDVHSSNEEFAELLEQLDHSKDWVVFGPSRERLEYNCCSLPATTVSVKQPFLIRITRTRIDLEVYPLPRFNPGVLQPPPRRFLLERVPE